MTAPTAPRASVFRLATLVIAGAARLVPEPARSDWRREWDAELWYRVAALEARGALDLPEQSRLIRRCLGAYRHALWVAARGAGRDLRSTPARSALAVSAVAVALAAGSVAFALATEVRVSAAPYPERWARGPHLQHRPRRGSGAHRALGLRAGRASEPRTAASR